MTARTPVEHAPEAVGEDYRPGSDEDFDRLYAATYPRIFRTMFALLRDRSAAEDCTQDAYLRAYQAWPRWVPSAPAEAWLHRIAINVATSFRRRERIRELAGAILRTHADPASDPADQALASPLLIELRALPPKQAAALVLRHVHGYTNREIGHALGVPERTIASRLAAARAQLQARLRGRAGIRRGGNGEKKMGTRLAVDVLPDE
jgi:RNA polymerase sigma-70 factor (ECF subfamily)